jgi:hypothetical protein
LQAYFSVFVIVAVVVTVAALDDVIDDAVAAGVVSVTDALQA